LPFKFVSHRLVLTQLYGCHKEPDVQNFEDLLSTLYHNHNQYKTFDDLQQQALENDYLNGIETILSSKGIDFNKLSQQKKTLLESLPSTSSENSWLKKILPEKKQTSLIENRCDDLHNKAFLISLEKLHKQFNSSKEIDEKAKKLIEKKLISTICQYLTCEGNDESNINKKRKKFALYTHPDKKNLELIPAVDWLDSIFGENSVFKRLDESIEKLKNPDAHPFHFSPHSEQEISIDDWILQAEEQAKSAPTYTQRGFYASLYALLISFKNHKITKQNSDHVLSQFLLNVTPLVTDFYCLSFFASEIAIAYGLSFGLSSLGGYMGHSESSLLRFLGFGLRYTSRSIFDITNMLIFGLTAGNLQLTSSAYNGGEYMLSLLTNESITQFPSPQEFASNLMPTSAFQGLQFNHLAIKLIASPLENYIQIQESQLLSSHRVGNIKAQVLIDVLNQFKDIDKTSKKIGDKLTKIEALLKPLFDKKEFQTPNSRSVLAISDSLKILSQFQHYFDDKKAIPIELITYKLQEYVDSTPKNQTFFALRTGKEKVAIIEQALQSIQLTMHNQLYDRKQKLDKIRDTINALTQNEIIMGSGTKAIKAVRHAQNVITSLSENHDERAIVEYTFS
jgi:hypothetical protein